jgi:hypothetical protein
MQNFEKNLAYAFTFFYFAYLLLITPHPIMYFQLHSIKILFFLLYFIFFILITYICLLSLFHSPLSLLSLFRHYQQRLRHYKQKMQQSLMVTVLLTSLYPINNPLVF